MAQIHLEKLQSASFAGHNLTGQMSQLGQSLHFGQSRLLPRATLSVTAAASCSVDLIGCSRITVMLECCHECV